MLYVAGEILIWMVLAGLLGLLLGWLLWGYRSKGEAERAERETQQRVAAAQQQATLAHAQQQELLALRARDTETIARLQAVAAATDAAKATDAAEMAGLRQRVAELEAQLADSCEERAEAEQRADAAEDILEEHEGWEPVGEIPGMEEAHQLLGKPVILDDLKMVEGVGPRSKRCSTASASPRGHSWRRPRRPAARRPRRRRPGVQRARPDDVAPAGQPRPRRPLGGAQGAPGEPARRAGVPPRAPTGIRRPPGSTFPAARAASMRAVVSRRLPKASRIRLPTTAST